MMTVLLNLLGLTSFITKKGGNEVTYSEQLQDIIVQQVFKMDIPLMIEQIML